jgi:hypothetical protein
MFRHAFVIGIIAAFCAVLLLTCSKSPVGPPPAPKDGSTSNGYFTIVIPAASDTFYVDSTLPIWWGSDASISDTALVGIYLYKGTQRVATISSSDINGGIYGWTISGVGSGTDYRIKICALPDTQHFDFSANFTIATGYDGTITVTAPAAGGRMVMDSQYTIRWTYTGSPGQTLNLKLYNDTTFVSLIVQNATTGIGSYSWGTVAASPGSGTRYRIKATSNYDMSLFSHSGYFTIASQYNGGFAFTDPVNGSIWHADSQYFVQWDTIGNPGALVTLQLYSDSTRLSTIAAGVPDNGIYSWAIPKTMLSGAHYRIKIICYNDAGIYAYSSSFAIAGMSPDAYEVDNTRAAASLLTLGTAQQHTITVNDTDWVRFTADSGAPCIIRDSGDSFRTSVALYYGSNTSATASNTANASGTLVWPWLCTKTGTWYARINPYTTDTVGRYSFKINKLDSLSSIVFITPTSSSTVPAGTSYAITWVPDSVILGTAVQLYCCKGGILFAPITAAAAPNSGTCSWAVPAGLASGSDYSIKIANSSSAPFCGFSQNFTVSGMTPDAYEADNTRASASVCALGTTQQHNITYNDTDWVQFTADSGSKYIFRDTGSAAFRTSLSLYYGSNVSATASNNTPASGTLVWPWLCTKTGTWYARITPYAAGSTGAYSFTPALFDSLTSITFIIPTSATTFTAGAANTISWVPDSGLLGTAIQLYCYKDGTLLAPIAATSTPNSGTFSWAVPAGFISGSDYSIKIVNYSSSQFYGYSQNFTINGMSPDAYEVDNTRGTASTLTLGTIQQHTLTFNDTDWVQFTADSGSKYIFRDTGSAAFRTSLSLYYGSNVSATASNNTPASGTLVWPWLCTKTGTWYARITPYTAGSTGAYTFTPARFDSLTSITFITPTSATTFTAGAANTISWVPDSSMLGSSVQLYCYKGDTLLAPITTSSPNSGTYSWAIPSGFISGSDYSIKIVNYSSNQFYGYSQNFTINGMAPDAYEVDNTRAAASALALGTTQQHNITYNDTDWVQFTADSGSKYIFRDTGVSSFRTSLSLYYGSDVSVTASNSAGASGTLVWPWLCTKTGTWYMRIAPYAAATYGAYFFSAIKFDSLSLITFIRPTSATTLYAGTTDTISWVPDSSMLGSSVQLYLYKGGSQLSPIAATSTPNSGTYSWAIPAGFISGSDYSIKIVNYSSSQFYGYSQNFTISGMSPDAYEVDNTRAAASALALGTTQQHNITYNDTDWVQFTADSGSKYIFRDTGVSSFRTALSLYYGSDVNATASNPAGASGTLVWPWLCTKTGTWYMRIAPYAAGAYNAYSFAMTRFDSLTSITFIIPTSATAFTAGAANTISWVPDSGLLGSSVQLYCYKGGTLFAAITATSAPNSGSYSWTIPSGFASGSDYSIKIVNYNSSQFYGYSQNFTISGMTPDAYEADNTRAAASTLALGTTQQHNITYNDTDWVRFALDSGTLYIIRDTGAAAYRTNINLYYGSDVAVLSSNSTSASGRLVWSWWCARSGTYYGRITPYTAGTYGSYSFSAEKFDSLSFVTFITPTSGTTFNAGASNTISWVPDSTVLGSSIRLSLYQGGRQVLTMVSSAPNSGTYAWALPAGFASGSDYQIKINNYSSTQYYGFSRAFTINGMAPDAYEFDNTRAAATVLTPGAKQMHTITYRDTDWVQFTADSGYSYVFRFSSDTQFHISGYVYYGSNGTSETWFDAGGLNDDPGNFVCTRTGTYYLMLVAVWDGYAGDYSVTMYRYDPLTVQTFTNPTASTVVSAGSPFTITWVPDTSVLGSSIFVGMKKGGLSAIKLDWNTQTNNGSFAVTIPLSALSGNDYRIVLWNSGNAAVTSLSPAFTITGSMAPDAYEPDNDSTLATVFTLGTPQERTLHLGDVDWVKLTLDSGAIYAFSMSDSSVPLGQRMTIFDSTFYVQRGLYLGGSDLTEGFLCPKSGTYYVKIFSDSPELTIYSLNIFAFDTLTTVPFTNPTSGSVFTKGTTVTVTWVADTVLFGTGLLSLQIYKGTQSQGNDWVDNTGSFSLTISSGTTTGSDYRLKLSPGGLSPLYSMSRYFTIQ